MKSKKNVEKVAIHESGHGIVGWFLKGGSPLIKLTIIPRSKGSLGYAQYLPTEESLKYEETLKDEIAVILGGRIAEEIFYGEVTTGAYDDLQKAYRTAEAIVMQYGMTEKIGLVQYPTNPYGLKAFSEETNQVDTIDVRLLTKRSKD